MPRVLSAYATAASNCIWYSLAAVPGVGSRRAQKRAMNALASSSLLMAFHCAASSLVIRNCAGPLPNSVFSGDSANAPALIERTSAVARRIRIFMGSPFEVAVGSRQFAGGRRSPQVVLLPAANDLLLLSPVRKHAAAGPIPPPTAVRSSPSRRTADPSRR